MGQEIQLRCAVIDDEPLARRLISSYVEKTPGLLLSGVFATSSECASRIASGDFDLLLLDIDMPQLNGIQLGEMVPSTTRIIYITAYDRYALEGFRVNALDYLLKPVSYPEFLRAVTKAIEWKTMSDALNRTSKAEPHSSAPSTITVKSAHRLILIRLDTIIYLEVKGDRVIFNRKDGLEPVSTLMSLKEVEALLPPATFMRVHRSFIVNLNMVEVVERGRIIFGKEYVPVSESYREEFLSRLSSH